MTTQTEALKRIAAYPFSRAEELSVEQMREIAREALAQQSNEHVPHCEAGPEYCWKCNEEMKPTYGNEEIRKLREVIASQAKIIEDHIPDAKKMVEPPPWWPAVENILNEYGLQAIDFVADFKAALAQQSNEQVEPAFWYSAQEDEFMTHKIRKEHERLNSYTHKVGKFDLPLYIHPPVPTAQPEQEPVAWLHWTHGPVQLFLNKDEAMLELDRLNREYPVDKYARQMKPLYTTPPQRTWVGLSVFEINDLVENTEYEDYRGLVEAVEIKLKEKNNA